VDPRRSLAISLWIALATTPLTGGCAGPPRNFRKIDSNTPLVRARAVSLGDDQPNSQVVPALVNRLGDSDPVVRLAACEELRRRTGNDFGFIPWDDSQNRQTAINRWKAWIKQGMPRQFRRPAAAPSAQNNAPASSAPAQLSSPQASPPR
jgi:hypothetical protein